MGFKWGLERVYWLFSSFKHESHILLAVLAVINNPPAFASALKPYSAVLARHKITITMVAKLSFKLSWDGNLGFHCYLSC